MDINVESFEETDSEISHRRRDDLYECITGEIVVFFPAADRPQESPAGILVGGFIAGWGRGADNLAFPVAVGDLFPVTDGEADDPAMRIPVGGIAAVRRGGSDDASFCGAESDLGAVLEGRSDNFSRDITVSGNAVVNGGCADKRAVGIKVIDRFSKQRSGEQ